MKPIIRNILAVIAGLVLGSCVNMSLIMVSGIVIPPPEGADVKTMEGLKASMHLFEPKHFVFPFLAHSLGTLMGAFLVSKLAASKKRTLALVVGLMFLVGGTINVFMLPSPLWFNILDLVAAYLPMAWLGGKVGSKGE